MITSYFSFRRAGSARPRMLKRAALFTSGAVTGAVVSTVASYGVVSVLFPRTAAPAVIAPSLPVASGLVPNADTPTLAVVAAAVPLAPNAQVVPIAPAAPRRVAVEPLVLAPSPVPAPVPAVAPIVAEQTAIERLAPADNFVIATKNQPEIDLPMAPDGLVGPDLAAAAATLAAPKGPAVLASADAATRAPTTLGFVPLDTRPAPRPDGVLALVDPAIEALPGLRPMPRPETLVVALTAPDDFSADIPGTRPEPRPDAVRLAALAASAYPAAEPAARRSGGLFASNDTCGHTLARAMPGRHSGAASGSQFLAGLTGTSGSDRDSRIITELARGNLPGFLRQLEPVTLHGKDSRGIDTEIVVCVTPDYLALGSDRDFIRVPLGLPAAARIAGKFDMTLPTPRMVDAIYAQADVHLSPAPMTPGPQMSSTTYFLRHNATIQDQLRGRGGLVAGQKKDLVMASRMASNPGRVAIYGWHRSSGSPIQPVSTVHGAHYADYSHGIRLVSKTAYLNGRPVDLDDLLSSSRYAYLLNKEGPLPGPVIRIASR